MGLRVVVRSDRMRAAVDWSPEGAERAPSAMDLRQALEREGITEIDDERVLMVSRALESGEPVKDLVIAEGIAPIEGEPGLIAWLFDPTVEKQAAGKLGSGDAIDFRERREFVEVEDGQCIARWTPPSTGMPGRSLFGELISPKPAAENRIQPGKNVRLTEDGTECFATLRGHAFASGQRISVDRLIEVRGDVDFRSGNVRYPGNVRIHGDVKPNFIVEADGNVTIRGVIEGAEVRCSGDLVVAGGILHGSRVFAGTGLSAKFIQDSHVECGGELRISDSLIHATVADAGSVRVGARGIVGSKLNCRGPVETATIGAHLSVPSILVLGTSPKDSVERSRLRIEIKEISEDIARLRKFIDAARQRERSSMAKSPGLIKLESALQVREAQLASTRARLEALDAALETTQTDERIVRVVGVAREGTEVRIFDKVYRLEHAIRGVVFHVDPVNLQVTATPIEEHHGNSP